MTSTTNSSPGALNDWFPRHPDCLQILLTCHRSERRYRTPGCERCRTLLSRLTSSNGSPTMSATARSKTLTLGTCAWLVSRSH
jgi:hypothetical protein